MKSSSKPCKLSVLKLLGKPQLFCYQDSAEDIGFALFSLPPAAATDHLRATGHLLIWRLHLCAVPLKAEQGSSTVLDQKHTSCLELLNTFTCTLKPMSRTRHMWLFVADCESHWLIDWLSVPRAQRCTKAAQAKGKPPAACGGALSAGQQSGPPCWQALPSCCRPPRCHCTGLSIAADVGVHSTCTSTAI